MVEMVSTRQRRGSPLAAKFKRIFDNQEELVRELLTALKDGNEKELIRIIHEGERNLESIGVVSDYVVSIIRNIESYGGAAKICGGGGKTKAAGILLVYHPDKNKLIEAIKSYQLPYLATTLGVEGLRQES